MQVAGHLNAATVDTAVWFSDVTDSRKGKFLFTVYLIPWSHLMSGFMSRE